MIGLPELIIATILVLSISFIYSNLGMGGGILFVPVLLWFTGLPKEIVAPISLLMIVGSALPAMHNHNKKGLVNFRLGAILGAGSIVGSIAGSLFNLSTGKEVFLWLFLIVLLISVTKLLSGWKKGRASVELNDDSKLTPKRIAVGATATIGAGFLAGSLGIGGGIINVPVLLYLLGRNTRTAVGTSFMVIIISALTSLVTYTAVAYHSEFFLGLLLMPLIALSSYIGSHWGLKKLKDHNVRLIFILILVLAAVKIGLEILGF